MLVKWTETFVGQSQPPGPLYLSITSSCSTSKFCFKASQCSSVWDEVMPADNLYAKDCIRDETNLSSSPSYSLWEMSLCRTVLLLHRMPDISRVLPECAVRDQQHLVIQVFIGRSLILVIWTRRGWLTWWTWYRVRQAIFSASLSPSPIEQWLRTQMLERRPLCKNSGTCVLETSWRTQTRIFATWLKASLSDWQVLLPGRGFYEAKLPC